MPLKPVARILLALLCLTAPANAQELRRATVWDLKLGQPVAAQPRAEEFRGFACGSNGGPPRQRLAGWSDFARCKAEPSGLHEVYFEYDDELEYIARAKDLEMNITRWAGTTEAMFPVIVSALFNDSGVLAGIRIVTDPRADYQDHITPRQPAQARRRLCARPHHRGALRHRRRARLPIAAGSRGRKRGGRAVHQAIVRDE